MKSVNNFAVTGFVGQDAKINKFNNASVARFGLCIARTEKVNGEDKRKSAFLNIEMWRKNENAASFDLLKKGNRITVEGYFKPEEYEKDGAKHQVITFVATKVSTGDEENAEETEEESK